MQNYLLWKLFGVVAFLAYIAFFGNFFWTVIDTLQKAKTRRLRYFLSAVFLLVAFAIFKVLDHIFENFIRSS